MSGIIIPVTWRFGKMNSNPIENLQDPKLVLLIDDDPDELEIYNFAISSLPFPCSCILANNSDTVIQLVGNLKPDLIIMDYSVPGKNGLEILEEIQTLPAVKNAPVVFCSTVMSDQIRDKALQAGATYCIKKFTELKDIVNLLRTIFTK